MRRVWSGVAATATLAVLVATFYRGILFQGLILGDYDAFVYFYPLRQYAADALKQGHFPLWNPYYFLGAPFFANIQTAVLYPGNLLFLLLPTPYAYSASVVGHVLLAGVAMYLFARRSLEVSALPALLGSIAFMFSGFLSGQVGHINQLTVAAWMPLLLVTFDEAVRRRSVALAIATGLVGTLQLLAGHTQEWYFSTVILGLLALWRAIVPRKPLRGAAAVRGGSGEAAESGGGAAPLGETALVPSGEVRDGLRGELRTEDTLAFAQAGGEVAAVQGDKIWPLARDGDDGHGAARGDSGIAGRVRPLAYLVVAGLIEVGISAVQVIPTLELSGESIRAGGMTYWDAASFSLPPTSALFTVLPTYPSQLFSEYVGHVGVVPLVLAILALVAWWTRPVSVFMAGLVALGMFMALGKYNPFYPFLFQWVPGLDLFRVPARWLLVYTLGVCGMAGLGAQLLLDLGSRRRRPPERRSLGRRAVTLRLMAPALVLAAAGAMLYLFYRFADPPPTPQQMQVWGALAALTLVLAALATRGRRIGWVVLGLLIAVVAGELWMAGETSSVRHPIPFEAYRPERTSTRYLLEDAATRDGPGRLLSFATDSYEVKETPDYKQQYGDMLHPDALVQFMVNVKLSETLAANIPMEYGIETVDGYDGGILPLRRYAALKDLLMPVPGIPADNQLRPNLAYVPPMRLLDLLNVRYVLGTKLQDTRIDGVYYDRGISIVLDPGQTERLRRMPDLTVTSIGLITSTEGAREQADGVPAASLMLADGSGVTLSLPVRMGMETGETPERDEVNPPPAHRKPTLVESWNPKEKPTEYYARINLPAPLKLKEISMTNLLSGAKVRVRAITLIDDRAGISVPLVLSDRMERQLFFDMKLYTVRDPLPRAFLVHNSLVRDDDRALEVLGRSELPLDSVVVLAASPTSRSVYRPLPPAGNRGEARLISHEPSEVVVDVKTDESGYLVLLDPYYPGWKAEVDGVEVPIERANYFFRAVQVGAGEHRVVFRYAPVSFQVGLYITLVSLAVASGTLLVLAGRALRRRPSPRAVV